MGRIWVELDPEGYSYLEEPGAGFAWSAADWLKRRREVTPAAAGTTGTPGSDRLLAYPRQGSVTCRPRQLSPLWHRDVRLDEHVVTDWTWSSSIAGEVRSFEPTRKADGTSYPANRWYTIPRVPAGAVSLFNPPWDRIADAAGFDLPPGMKVLGTVRTLPTGHAPPANVSPFIQIYASSAPESVAACGFGQHLLLFTSGGVTLLKASAPGAPEVIRIGHWPYPAVTAQQWLLAAHQFQQFVRSVLVTVLAPGHLGIFLTGGSEPQVVKVVPFEPGECAPRIVEDWGWWVAAPEKGRLTFQLQVTGYELGDTELLVTGEPAPDFDLGSEYLPTLQPVIDARMAIFRAEGSAPAPGETVRDEHSFTVSIAETAINVSLELRDQAGNDWDSDGTRRSGRWRLLLGPSMGPGPYGSYLSPQVFSWSLTFPAKSTDRLATPLLLDDSHFRSVRAETKYGAGDGKRLEIDLWDSGLKLLTDAGLDSREGYPVHVLEDTTGNGLPDTLRIAGWVRQPDITEHLLEIGGLPQVRFYRLTAGGLLARADRHWQFPPVFVDPYGDGYVEHTYAVSQSLRMAGFDPGDPGQVFIAIDTQAGTARSRLPGTWKNAPEGGGQKEAPYSPAFDETILAYMDRIARQWAGWVLYETLAGRVMYHPDLQFELSLGPEVGYYRSAVIHGREADALAAAAPRQKYLAAAGQRVKPVQANVVTIHPPEDEDAPQFDPVTVRDSAGWLDPSYENFVGEPVPQHLSFSLAGTQQDARILALVALLDRRRRLVDWAVEVPLATWDWQTTAEMDSALVDCGYVVQVSGKGDRLLIHLELELLQSRAMSEWRARCTTRALPSGSARITGGIAVYPGRMVGTEGAG
jgi:hypothetical protein